MGFRNDQTASRKFVNDRWRGSENGSRADELSAARWPVDFAWMVGAAVWVLALTILDGTILRAEKVMLEKIFERGDRDFGNARRRAWKIWGWVFV